MVKQHIHTQVITKKKKKKKLLLSQLLLVINYKCSAALLKFCLSDSISDSKKKHDQVQSTTQIASHIEPFCRATY